MSVTCEITMTDITRSCSGCTLCCKLLPVPTFDNPANTWCPKCEVGKGCGIYATRPDDCKGFACQWLLGAIPENLKPDKVHAVMYTNNEGKDFIVHLDTHRTAHSEVAKYLKVLQNKGISFFVTQGGITQRFGL